MQATKFLKIVIVLLLLINIATLTFLWLGNPQRHDGPPRHHGGRGPGEYLIHELKLTDDQRNKYDVMRRQHHEAFVDIKQIAAGYRQRINSQLKDVNPDSLLLRQLSDSIGFCQRDAELLTFYHFQDLRKICNPEQQKKFDEIIQEAIEMIIRGR